MVAGHKHSILVEDLLDVLDSIAVGLNSGSVAHDVQSRPHMSDNLHISQRRQHNEHREYEKSTEEKDRTKSNRIDIIHPVGFK